MFAEFTELFSVHHCTGRQLFTSLTRPSFFDSSIVVTGWPSIKVTSRYSLTTSNPIIARKHRIIAKIFLVRILVDLLVRNLFLLFSFHLDFKLPNRPSANLSNRKPPNYFAAAYRDRGRIVFFILSQFCYTAKTEAMSFLHSSYGRPQVQTVPSSARDAPCPVVTPSHMGLARHFLFFTFVMF